MAAALVQSRDATVCSALAPELNIGNPGSQAVPGSSGPQATLSVSFPRAATWDSLKIAASQSRNQGAAGLRQQCG